MPPTQPSDTVDIVCYLSAHPASDDKLDSVLGSLLSRGGMTMLPPQEAEQVTARIDGSMPPDIRQKFVHLCMDPHAQRADYRELLLTAAYFSFSEGGNTKRQQKLLGYAVKLFSPFDDNVPLGSCRELVSMMCKLVRRLLPGYSSPAEDQCLKKLLATSHSRDFPQTIDASALMRNGVQSGTFRCLLHSPIRTPQVLEVERFVNQVGGHGSENLTADQISGSGSSSSSSTNNINPDPTQGDLYQIQKKDMLVDKTGRIWKPMDEKEAHFYELLAVQAQQEPDARRRGLAVKLQSFVPKYYGRTYLTVTGEPWHYIVMEDLTGGLERPCIIDLKMGDRGYGDDAHFKKKLQQLALVNATTSACLGFRVCGIHVWHKDGQKFQVKDKKWGARYISNETMDNAITMFLSDGVSIRTDCLPPYLSELRNILAWFEQQDVYRFYSSSILLMYDGATNTTSTKVMMVDFAHVHTSSRGVLDDSYLFGLRTLVNLMERVEKQAGGEFSPIHGKAPSIHRNTGIDHDWREYRHWRPYFCVLCHKIMYATGLECSNCAWYCHTQCGGLFPPKSCPGKSKKTSKLHHHHGHGHAPAPTEPDKAMETVIYSRLQNQYNFQQNNRPSANASFTSSVSSQSPQFLSAHAHVIPSSPLSPATGDSGIPLSNSMSDFPGWEPYIPSSESVGFGSQSGIPTSDSGSSQDYDPYFNPQSNLATPGHPNSPAPASPNAEYPASFSMQDVANPSAHYTPPQLVVGPAPDGRARRNSDPTAGATKLAPTVSTGHAHQFEKLKRTLKPGHCDWCKQLMAGLAVHKCSRCGVICHSSCTSLWPDSCVAEGTPPPKESQRPSRPRRHSGLAAMQKITPVWWHVGEKKHGE
eukprot:TRINITY_DN57494_c0_g1_i1.p1 TRINITY_DN57494_c0_g1~~TRINITY_DN57494_c0_g1_i1.p1  ORF type:complete len:867 (-),score=42.59 TRINITY_DN57494_c0_g1_i1:149-2749(-)